MGGATGDVYAAAQRVKLDGTPVGAELALPPLFVLGSDGAGAPLLWGVSGTYLVDPATSSWQRVSEQRLVGWGAAAFVDLGCDAGLPCHWRVHDRLTGETRLLPEPVPDEALRTFDRGRVSPDGRWLARVGRDGSSLQVVDLATGSLRDLVAEGDGVVSDLAWSPDGHWLFWLGADQITTWKVGSCRPGRAQRHRAGPRRRGADRVGTELAHLSGPFERPSRGDTSWETRPGGARPDPASSRAEGATGSLDGS